MKEIIKISTKDGLKPIGELYTRYKDSRGEVCVFDYATNTTSVVFENAWCEIPTNVHPYAREYYGTEDLLFMSNIK